MKQLLRIHDNNGYTKARPCYTIRTII